MKDRYKVSISCFGSSGIMSVSHHNCETNLEARAKAIAKCFGKAATFESCPDDPNECFGIVYVPSFYYEVFIEVENTTTGRAKRKDDDTRSFDAVAP